MWPQPLVIVPRFKLHPRHPLVLEHFDLSSHGDGICWTEMGAVSWVRVGHGWFVFAKMETHFAEMCHLFVASSLGYIDGPLNVAEIAHATDVHLHERMVFKQHFNLTYCYSSS